MGFRRQRCVNRILSVDALGLRPAGMGRMGQQKQEEWARWRSLITEQRGSGQSIGVFCRERGLRAWQFYEWKKRLRPAEAEAFVAVEVVACESSSVPAPPAPVPIPPLEIRLRSGRSLLVGPDFEAGHLQRLLRVLEQEE
jgi:hypothetical protein